MGSRMAEVAKMRGVEFDEAFKIKEAPLAIYKIVENGLLQYDRERDCWNLAPRLLTEILAGYIEIVEPAWEPKEEAVELARRMLAVAKEVKSNG